MSLRYRIQETQTFRIVGILLAFFFLAFTLAFSWQSWREVKTAEIRNMETLVKIGASAVNNYFLQIERALKLLEQDIGYRLDKINPQRAYALLARFKTVHPDFRILVLSTPDGRVLATSDTPPGKSMPVLSSPSYKLAIEELDAGQHLNIGRSTVGQIVRGEWVIPLRYGARDDSGNLLYVLSAVLPLDKPQEFWRNAPLNPEEAMGLRRDDGYGVTRYPIPPKSNMAEVYGSQRSGALSEYFQREYEKEKKYPTSGVVEGTSSIAGTGNIFVIERLQNYPVTFYITNPLSNIVSRWWQRTRFTYLSLALLMTGSIAVYIWSRRRQRRWDEERQKIERSLIDSNASLTDQTHRLAEANKELEAFSYSVSHDLRAPLRGIDGWSLALLEDYGPRLDKTGRDHLERVRAEANRMGKMIDDIIGLAKTSRTNIKVQRVDLSAHARATVARLREIEKTRSVNVLIADQLACDGDPMLLGVALENLLDNAWKFTGKRTDAAIEFGAENIDGETVYFVRDNGAGFDESHAANLFGAFQRLHRASEFPGTGIGLANVRRIISRHGGRIWAKAKPNEGATFFFTIGSTL